MNSMAESDTDAFIRRERENMLMMNRQLQQGLAINERAAPKLKESTKKKNEKILEELEGHRPYSPRPGDDLHGN
jgi:hypothetical protein